MSTTMPVTTETLKVPGASLYYEVRGSGPVLLMMPGGPADAAAFRNTAVPLASDYTVVTYDPRGLSHSKLDSPLDEERIVQVFADDVHRLLSAITKEKAFVFASSGGASISLELAARHPEQLSTLIPHEPPSPALQPDPAYVRWVVGAGTAAWDARRRVSWCSCRLRQPPRPICGQAARGAGGLNSAARLPI